MGQSISGQLQYLSLPDVISLINQSSMNGSLQVATEDGVKGTLIFVGGKLVHAVYGNIFGDEAANHIMTWTNGTFSFTPGDWDGDPTITLSVEKFILDYTLRQDEDIAEIGQSISGTHQIRLARDTSQPDGIVLEPIEWSFLSCIQDGVSIAQITSELEITTDEARRIVAKLTKLGFVKIVAE
ncbi:MAG TPA: DUF4388 domain-containing protein [Caldisericia bacterium]|jgi:hypothetical protein|nr:DUF4388 domain-containing protein [Caldisericia bacterium]MCE5176064.1 DUF4388 domain-containing protein [bacterium]MBP6928755.1 DUF4388 domain-containing protein [Caldisericia bacterium]HOR46182.1 DUF4388 domain-containing protein [Caldisericia bacterium]HOU08875.1 DUF4388 domain-containing protein [Caldisericia bacterium]